MREWNNAFFLKIPSTPAVCYVRDVVFFEPSQSFEVSSPRPMVIPTLNTLRAPSWSRLRYLFWYLFPFFLGGSGIIQRHCRFVTSSQEDRGNLDYLIS